MVTWITKRKCKVHEDTELVKDIVDMAKWCRNMKTIAEIVGCHYSYVRLVLKMKKSQAHVFLSRNTLLNMR